MDNPQPQFPRPTPGPSSSPMPPSNLPIGGMEARTMGSDIKSVQESGGGAPRPFAPGAFSVPPAGGSAPIPPVVPKPPVPPVAPSIPPVIPRPSVPPIPPIPPRPSMPQAVPAPQPLKKSGSKKGLFGVILALVLIAGAAALGYFFVFPLFFGKSDAPAAPEGTASPLPSPDEGLPSSDFFNPPPVLSPEPEPESVPPAESVIPAPPAPAGHTSFLSTPADITSQVTLEVPSAGALRETLGFTTVQVPSLKEVVLKKSDGIVYEFPEIGAALLPEFFTEDMTSLLALDFTFAVYTDSRGSWPVYILEASSADLSFIQQRFAGIETAGVAALGNLFLSSPGGSGAWKDGSVLGASGRYLTFTQAGASLNYAWIGNRLVLGTSYAATQEAVRRLR